MHSALIAVRLPFYLRTVLQTYCPRETLKASSRSIDRSAHDALPTLFSRGLHDPVQNDKSQKDTSPPSLCCHRPRHTRSASTSSYSPPSAVADRRPYRIKLMGGSTDRGRVTKCNNFVSEFKLHCAKHRPSHRRSLESRAQKSRPPPPSGPRPVLKRDRA